MRAWIVTWMLCSSGLAAAANPPPPTPPEDPAVASEAKRHFTQAVALYNEGNYDAALAEFEACYRIRPGAPAVLFNIGLTQKALFRYTEAIVSIEKYLAEEKKVPPEQRALAEQMVREMKALLADVTIEIEPAGAAVRLDGRAFGNAPLPVEQIPAGNHTIELSADGYKPLRREFVVAAGMPLALKLKLEAIPKTARVHITTSRPPRAAVAIDGRGLGLAPVDAELLGGGHQLEVSAPKYRTYLGELVVQPGQPRSLDIALDRTSHLYEKWYLWTPIAVGAAGLAIGLGVGLTQREGPIQGTLNPGAGRVN